jgi:hypothetical protein
MESKTKEAGKTRQFYVIDQLAGAAAKTDWS